MPIALNEDIAGRLDEVARILAEQGANRFRVQATTTRGPCCAGWRDSVPAPADPWSGLNIVFLAPLLAAAFRRFRTDESIEDLYAHVVHSGGTPLSGPSV